MDRPETPTHHLALGAPDATVEIAMENGSTLRLRLRAVGHVSPTITAVLEPGESVLFTAVDERGENLSLLRPHTISTRDGRQVETPEAPLQHISRVLARHNERDRG